MDLAKGSNFIQRKKDSGKKIDQKDPPQQKGKLKPSAAEPQPSTSKQAANAAFIRHWEQK
jgi:hypothetical protein